MTYEALNYITPADLLSLIMRLCFFPLPPTLVLEGWNFFSVSVTPMHPPATESLHCCSLCNSTLSSPFPSLLLTTHPSGLSLITIEAAEIHRAIAMSWALLCALASIQFT